MTKIYETNDSFLFQNLKLSKPALMPGGSYFIRCAIDNQPLYIQPPTCTTKQGILRSGKRMYTDLVFTNLNADFIRWMEYLENHCQNYLFENREEWFEGSMDKHDVENYFTSPLKIYKSGKNYLARIGVPCALGKPTISFYDENENEVEPDTISDSTDIMTILEIKGIKCSSTCFQIEMELKQLLVMQPKNMFGKCVIKPHTKQEDTLMVPPIVMNNMLSDQQFDEPNPLEPADTESIEGPSVDNTIDISAEEPTEENAIVVFQEENIIPQSDSIDAPSEKTVDGMEEIEVHLEELPMEESITIKKRNDVYYQMYREARRKAKLAKNLAISSYLEARRIKNTYILEDMEDSDISDEEMDNEDTSMVETETTNI